MRIPHHERTKISVNMFITINNKRTKIGAETNKEVEHKNYHYFTNRQIISEIIINKVPKFSIKLII